MKVSRVASYTVPRTPSLQAPSLLRILYSDAGVVPIEAISPRRSYARSSGDTEVWIDKTHPFRHYGGVTGRLGDHRDGLVLVPNRYLRYHLDTLKDVLVEMRPVLKAAGHDLEVSGGSDEDALLAFYGKALEWGEELADELAESEEHHTERDRLIAGLAADIAAGGGLCLPWLELVGAHVDVVERALHESFGGPMGAMVLLDFEDQAGKRRQVAFRARGEGNSSFAVSTLRGRLLRGATPALRTAWHESLALGFINARAMAELAATRALVARPGMSERAVAGAVLERMGATATALMALPGDLVPNAVAGYRDVARAG